MDQKMDKLVEVAGRCRSLSGNLDGEAVYEIW